MVLKRAVLFIFFLVSSSRVFIGPVHGDVVDRDVWRASVGSERPLQLRFNEPAKHWTDALPIGNGWLGAMIWGGVANETLNLNEDTLWTGTPGNYGDPNAPEVLRQVRKLVNNRQYSEATTLAANLSGIISEAYQLLGDLKLEFDYSHAAYDEGTYHRVLDLNNATVTTKYSVNRTEYTREHFASNPDKTIVTKICSSKPASLNFTISLDSKLHHHSYVNDNNQIVMEGSCPGSRGSSPESGNPKGIQFSSVLDLQISGSNGKVTLLDGRRLRVEGCDSAVILLVASSSFDGPFTKPVYSGKDPSSESLRTMDSVKKFSYADLYERHVRDYEALFHRVSLQLSSRPRNGTVNGFGENKVATSERVRSFKTDEDPSLVELLFQYGRYLLISCSRPGSQAANLQGIWNKDVSPPWDGAPHLNINLQMNYWPSLSCNLNECQEPLFDYISSLSKNGAKTAKVNYKASGWVAHQVSDIWAKTSPDRGQAVWALWPMGGAWLCTHLTEHYSYTMDKEFLKNKAYPLLEGCASFLLDWLIEGHGGVLQTNPSTSPEHVFIAPDGKPASVSYSSTMDIAIIREVFLEIVFAAKELGKSEDDLIARVREALPSLPAVKIAPDGSIMEWAENFQDPEPQHRHLSHLFGLFPGHTITLEQTPDLCKAANYSLYKRGEQGPGWSTVWKIALWSRLHQSDHAYRMVKHIFDLVVPDIEGNYEGGLYSNLFAAHPPFQIDANFGFSAAIAEMLVQSTIKDLILLPSLPRGKWPNGCVKGLKARGGVTVSVCWSKGNLDEVGIWSKDQSVVKRLHYNGISTTARISSGSVYTFDSQLRCVNTYSL